MLCISYHEWLWQTADQKSGTQIRNWLQNFSQSHLLLEFCSTGYQVHHLWNQLMEVHLHHPKIMCNESHDRIRIRFLILSNSKHWISVEVSITCFTLFESENSMQMKKWPNSRKKHVIDFRSEIECWEFWDITKSNAYKVTWSPPFFSFRNPLFRF